MKIGQNAVGTQAALAAAIALLAAGTATAGAADTYYERAFVVAADARCDLFEPQIGAALTAATAQARFTGLVVVLLPLGGAVLAELASPGFVGGLLGSFLTAWLVGLAVAMQVAAAFLIRRLGRVRW